MVLCDAVLQCSKVLCCDAVAIFVKFASKDSMYTRVSSHWCICCAALCLAEGRNELMLQKIFCNNNSNNKICIKVQWQWIVNLFITTCCCGLRSSGIWFAGCHVLAWGHMVEWRGGHSVHSVFAEWSDTESWMHVQEASQSLSLSCCDWKWTAVPRTEVMDNVLYNLGMDDAQWFAVQVDAVEQWHNVFGAAYTPQNLGLNVPLGCWVNCLIETCVRKCK